jgi:hypothetical protein
MLAGSGRRMGVMNEIMPAPGRNASTSKNRRSTLYHHPGGFESDLPLTPGSLNRAEAAA